MTRPGEEALRDAFEDAEVFAPSDESNLAALAALSPLDYDRKRQKMAESLGVRVGTLDAAVAKLRGETLADTPADAGLIGSWAIESWPELVPGAEILDDLVAVFSRYVVLPAHGARALALWTLHAWAHDAAAVSPLVVLVSPEKRSGKTTTLLLLRYVAPRPLPAANVTAPVLFRAVERWRPTLLVDEADTFLAENAELRGIINSGHVRAMAQTIRCVGDEHEPRTFATWAPKALALIGRLHDTLRDRSIVLEMRRRLRSERVERLRGDQDAAFADLRRRAARWAADSLEALRVADPELPDALGDRAADNWRPLVAIADLAGGTWPARAREAALALSGEGTTDTESIRTALLADIRAAFEELGQRITSADLAERLGRMEERPWPEWHRGRPISVRQVANLLRPFGIEPTTIRAGEDRGKGYKVEDFEDVFRRYLPSDPCQRDKQHGIRARADFPSVTTGDVSRIENEGKSAPDARCHAVTDENGEMRRIRVFAPESDARDDLEEARGVLADLRELDANPRVIGGSLVFRGDRLTDSVRARAHKHSAAVVEILAAELDAVLRDTP
jgi:putative DNA primase/helicase